MRQSDREIRQSFLQNPARRELVRRVDVCVNETDGNRFDLLPRDSRHDRLEVFLVQWLSNRTIPAEPFSNFHHVSARHQPLWLAVLEREELLAVTSRDGVGVAQAGGRDKEYPRT